MTASPIEDIYPLSPLQQGLLFHALRAEEALYVEQEVYTFRGGLDAASLERAWSEVVRRHAALRTSFQWEDLDEPVQVVWRQVQLSLPVHDWRSLPAEERQARLEALLAEGRKPMDLERPPLLRQALARLDEDTWVLVWSFHHLLLDGWSRSLVLRESLALYEAFRTGRSLPHRPPRPYREYIAWLQRQDLGAVERFWRAELHGFSRPTILDLPFSGRREGKEPAVVERWVSAEGTAALRALGRRLRVTTNTLVQGALALLLTRYTGEEDVLFGATVSGRPAELPGVEEMVGLFINTLPIRARLGDETELVPWLRQLQERQVELRRHEHSPLVQVQGWSEIPRGVPLFETLLVFENFPGGPAADAGGDGGPLVEHRGSAGHTNYPLTLLVGGTETLGLRAAYDAERFDRITVRRLVEHLRTALEALARGPARCGQVSLLTTGEEHQLRAEWNDVPSGAPSPECIHHLFARQAARRPEAPAVLGTESSLTYGELHRRAWQLARRLRRLGVGPEDRVALKLERGPDLLVGLLGVLASGGAYVPLDPSHPGERLAMIVEDAAPRAVVTQESLRDGLSRWAAAGLPVLSLDAEGSELAGEPGEAFADGASGDSLAYILFTSGSTGRPKGVPVIHRALANILASLGRVPGLNEGDRMLAVTTYSFDVAAVELLLPLLVGAAVEIVPREVAVDGSLLAQRIAASGATVVQLTATGWRLLVESGWPGDRRLNAFSCGEALPRDLADRLVELVGELWDVYGPTETTIYSTLARVEAGDPAVPIGRPVDNTRVHVLDRWGRPVPAGVPGELFLGGMGLARGYLGDPARTAEKFVPDPFGASPGARLYRTGDRARLRTNGELEYLGRLDQQLKIRGFRIEPGEIEVSLRLHPAVAEAAVVARPRPGGSELRLLAYVVPRPEAARTGLSAELRAFLRERQPDYLVPEAVVLLDEIPLTATGKLDRRALPDAETLSRSGEGGEAAPSSLLRDLLASLWREVLDVPQVGERDDFFALGGHSLTALRLVSRLRAAFGVELPVREVFERPRLAALAERIEQALRRGEGTAAPPLVPVTRDRPIPLSFAQLRLWVLHQLAPEDPAYNLAWRTALSGDLDVRALEAALREVLRRHEALRTRFEIPAGTAEGEPVQRIDPPPALLLPRVDLSALPEPARRETAARLARAEAARPFDLARGPLVRALLLRLGSEEHETLLTLHHAVTDGWSMGILVGELSALYATFREGLPSPLPELPIQYADFAVWQRSWLQGEVLERHVGVWRRRLAGAPPVLDLPTDRPRPPVRRPRGGRRRIAVPAERTAELRRFCRSERATPFMVLLASFQALLARLSGQDRVSVGTPVAGRNRLETEGAIGLFVNTLVLHADLSDAPGLRPLLERVREAALEADAHQDLPFEKLVEELRPERDPGRSPLFQVLLSLQTAPRHDRPWPGLTLRGVDVEPGGAKLDLALALTDAGDRIVGDLDFDAELFDAATVERIGNRFLELLGEALAAPDRSLAEMPWLPASERRQILEWGTGLSPAPGEGASVAHRLAEQAAHTPEAVAVEMGGRRISYRDLHHRVSAWARRLQDRGVGTETRVALCLPRSPELVMALLAVLEAGGAYVPLDPSHPADRLAFLLEDSGASLLLTDESLAAVLPAPHIPRLLVGREEFEDEPSEPTAGAAALPSERAAYVLYTSGSTGRPKGVVVTHRALGALAVAQTARFGVGPGDRVLQLASPGFDASVSEILMALWVGATLVLGGQEEILPGPGLVKLLAERAITHVTIPPSSLAALPEAELPALVSLIVAGEACPPDLAARWSRGRRFFNAYGPTEATVCATMEEWEGGRLTVGRPIPGVRIHVVDRRFEPTGIGVPGELLLGGPGLARGYSGRPDLTAERFLPDPFGEGPGERLYRTGDLARFLADGRLEFLGRIDWQLKVRGVRIEPGEIEAALAAQEGVAACAVSVREEAPGDRRLTAWVVPRGGIEPGAVWREARIGEIRAGLATRLPETLIPSSWVFLDALPIGPHGKVDRRALPAPGRGPADTTGLIPPRGAVEEELARVWREVLRVEAVGRHDNFFHLGGDSILSIQVVTRAQQAGLALTPRQVFQHQTLAELATVATARHAEPEPEPGEGEAPLTPIQRRFFEELPAEPHHFNQAVLLEVHGGPPPAAAHRAFAAWMARHDALRLRFAPSEPHLPWVAAWRQLHAPLAEALAAPPFSCLDLTALPPERRRRELEEAAARLQASLDLGRGPVLCGALFDLGTGGWRLFVTIHHLAVDSVSWRILLEDLASAFQQAEAGDQIVLPPRTTSWKRWAEHLQERARSAEVREEASWWLDLPLAGLPPLPVDVPGAEPMAGTLRSAGCELPEEETRWLLVEVPPVYRTRINDLLLAALARVLAGWTGDGRALIQLEGHGREEADGIDLSRTVGWFTTAFPVLLDLREASGPGETIRAVKEQLHRIPGNGIGYGLLRYLAGDRGIAGRLAAQPSPQVSFNYLGQIDAGGAAGSALFRPAAESSGPAQGPHNLPPTLLDVLARVAGGRLQLNWTYSAAVHRASTVEALAHGYIAALRELIAHCLSPWAGGYTPSDFPLAKLDARALDRLLEGKAGRGQDLEDVYPLSPLQQGMLFHALYAPESTAYFEQTSLVLQGAIDPGVLTQAWEWILDRHPVLRTGFESPGAEPLQIVWRRVEAPVEIADWSGVSTQEREERLRRWLAADRARPFDLARPPLLRIFLARLGPAAWQLVWSHHHLLLDGWCMPIVIRELLETYEALLAGRQPELPPARPYRDYIAWLLRQDLGVARSFWRRELEDVTGATPLGIVRTAAGPAGQAQQRMRLPAAVTAALGSLARRHQLTLNTLVQGAWARLLGVYGGTDDVIFGAVVSGRPPELPGVESMVGLFINTLPVRARLAPAVRQEAWLRELQDRQTELRQYEHTPLVEIQGCTQVPRDQPLFETLFAFEKLPVHSVSVGDGDGGGTGEGRLEAEDIRTVAFTELPLTVVVTPGTELTAVLKHDSRLDEAAVLRLAGHLEALLTGMAAGLERPLSALTLLSEVEKHQILREWNESPAGLPLRDLVHHVFEARAAAAPDDLAVVAGEATLTCGELNRRANRLARRLRELGIGPESRVAVGLEHSLEMAVTVLAIHKAGGAYLGLDPEAPRERSAWMMADAGVAALVTVTGLRERLPATTVPTVLLDADRGCLEVLGDDDLGPVAGPDNLAYVIYTSGSTGRPKGVLTAHAQLLGYLSGILVPLAPEPGLSWAVHQQLSVDAPVTYLFAVWVTGGVLHLIPRDVVSVPEDLAAYCERHRLDYFKAAPSHFASLLSAERPERLMPRRLLMLGGEASVRDWIGEIRRIDPACAVLNHYGPTETTVGALTYTVDDATLPGLPPTIPIGRPLAHASAWLLDRWLDPVPVGVPGEMYLGGGTLARGYSGRPDLTAERFLPDPFSGRPGARLYRTGDLVRQLSEGNFEFLGRVDHQVKIRGFRIELEEIETVLARHPLVRSAVVTVREDAAAGRYLVACLVAGAVPGEASEPPAAAVREAAVAQLPSYMVPSRWVWLEELPRTAQGKVDRRRLPDPEPLRTAAETVADVPRTPVEDLVAGLWGEVLGLERVGLDDDFFALGGHSLLAARVVARARAAFGVDLPLRTLFEEPTVAGLAREIEALLRAGSGTQAPPLEPAPRHADLPLSFAQHRLWFLQQLDPGSFAYNVLRAVRLQGELDGAALERAANEVVRRHEILRTAYTEVEGTPWQRPLPPGPVDLPRIDLAGLPEAAREAEMGRIAAAEVRRPFDLARGPVLRFTLLRLGSRDHAVLLALHHIASDGWSTRLLLGELTSLYQAFHLGQPSPLPELPVQYADFARWEREWLQGEVLEAHLAYWRRQLGGGLPDLALPADHPRPPALSGRGGRQSFPLPDVLTEELRALSRREGATLFMTLLAAWLTLLHRLSGQDDFAIGADSTNRSRVETEGLIGFFVNMIVLRTDLAGNPAFRDLLVRVRETCLGAFAHQDLPFEKLVEELRPQRGVDHSPLFRAVFNFNSDPRMDEGGPVELAGLTASPLSVADEVVRFDLTLHIQDGPGGLRASWTYSRDLFEDESIARLHRRFATLLGAVVTSPRSRLHDLEIRDSGELEEEAGRRRALEEAQRDKLRSLRGRRGGGLGAGTAG